MKNKDIVYKINSISELNSMLNQDKAKHPLVSVVDFSMIEDYGQYAQKYATAFYTIMFKEKCNGALKYGREYYDFQEGTLIFIAPEQVLAIEADSENPTSIGWGLFFHPDLIRGTSLANKMKEYTFFSYDINEALHLSEAEKQILVEIVEKIQVELSQNIDKHSQTLIVSNIELLLNYCTRYYDRQFITRTTGNKGILAKFDHLLENYFNSELLKELGLPSVKYCAEELNLSPNYLSDLLKKETGKNTQEHIHYYLIEAAKNRLLSSNQSVSEIAYDLGFDYPQYFSKVFKKKTGISPNEYRNLNTN